MEMRSKEDLCEQYCKILEILEIDLCELCIRFMQLRYASLCSHHTCSGYPCQFLNSALSRTMYSNNSSHHESCTIFCRFQPSPQILNVWRCPQTVNHVPKKHVMCRVSSCYCRSVAINRHPSICLNLGFDHYCIS